MSSAITATAGYEGGERLVVYIREELVCVVNQSVTSSFWGLKHEQEAEG